MASMSRPFTKSVLGSSILLFSALFLKMLFSLSKRIFDKLWTGGYSRRSFPVSFGILAGVIQRRTP